MKKGFLIALCILCLGFCFVTTQAKAEMGHAQTPGWFIGVGGLVGGFEVNELKAIGGGFSGPVGYKFNEYVSLYLQTDIYYTRDSGVNFLFNNMMPTVKFNVYETLFLYGGAGYTMLYGWGGFVAGNFSFVASSIKHGFGGDAGIGYDFYITDNWSVTPQGGVNYTYIASTHLITPNVRVNIAYHF